MRTGEYWSKRFEDLNEAQFNKGAVYVKSMHKQYAQAMNSIQRDIDVFYKRFADNNGIVDMANARQVLKAGELKEFKWTVEDYIEKGRENAVDQRWMKELENASIRVRVSRLEALQTQMRQQVEVLAAKRQTGTQELLGEIYKDNYHQSIFELQKGAGFGSSFAKLDTLQVDKLLSRPWAPDGTNFSGRIWKDRDKLLSELQTTLTQGIIRGDTSDEMISSFSERMGVSRSNAERLILTELAYFSGQSRLDAFRELGVEQYKFLATLDKRTSEVCRGMDAQVFPIEEARAGVNYPPLHAYCRSTTIPHYEDNVQERAARDEDGKTYMVPGDMTYKEWAKEHVKSPDKPKPSAPPDSTPPATPVQEQTENRPDMEDFEVPRGEVEEPPTSGPNRRYNPRASYFAELPEVEDDVLDVLADVNREVVRKGYKEAKETVVLLDSSNGEEIARASGTINKVAFTEEMHEALLSAAPRSVVLTHNHPRGTRVNVKDALNLATYASLNHVVAAGHDGGVSFVSAGKEMVDWIIFKEVFEKVAAQILVRLQNDSNYVKMSKTAQAEYFDYLVLQGIIQELGWTYGEDFSAAKADYRYDR
jgi:SPP1 gp7 family putative phage head morphogenesis protein